MKRPMSHLHFSLIATACFSLSLSCRKEQAADTSYEVTQLQTVQALQEEFVEKLKRFRRSVADTGSDGERLEYHKQFARYWETTSNQMLAIAEDRQSLIGSERAAIWIVDNGDSDDDVHFRAAEILLARYATSAHLDGICADLDGFHPVYEKLLRQIAVATPSESTRAKSLYVLGDLLMRRATYRHTMLASPELREERINNLGHLVNAYLQASDPNSDYDEARRTFERVRHDFFDVQHFGSKLGLLCESQLACFEQRFAQLDTIANNILDATLVESNAH